jgi:hypothetical protein
MEKCCCILESKDNRILSHAKKEFSTNEIELLTILDYMVISL